MIKKESILTDMRKTNPALHLLYIKWTVQHLVTIERCYERPWFIL